MDDDSARSTAPSDPNQAEVRARSTRSRLPTRSRLSMVCSILAVAFFVVAAIVWNSMEDIDRQYALMGTTPCVLLAMLFGMLAVVTHRRIPWIFKIGALAAPPLAVWGFLQWYEFAGFSGEVWPTFRARGATAARQGRSVAQRPGASSERETVAANRAFRFSQLLGNERNGVVDAPEFSMQWDARLPQVVWRKEIGAGWSGFAVSNGRAITLHQRDSVEVVAAWELESGQTIWEHEIPGRHFHPLGGLGPRSTPTIASVDGRDVVLVQSALGVVACLDLETGKPLWSLNLLQEAGGITQEESEQEIMWGRSGSPLVVDGVVVVPFGGSRKKSSSVHSLIAVELATGKRLWVGGSNQIAYSSPNWLTVDGVPQIVSVNEDNVTGHDVATGDVLWESAWPSKSNGDACASQPVLVDGNKILLGKGYAQGAKLIEVRHAGGHSSPGPDAGDRQSQGWEANEVWWNKRTLKTKFTSAVILDGNAYALSDGTLECVDPMTGTRVWRGPRYGQGQILLVNGGILVLSEDGRIASVDRATGRPLAEMQVLEGVTWNIPTVAGPYLLVRNGDEAVCLLSPRE